MPSREWPLRIQDILDAIARIRQSTAEMTFEDFTNIDELLLQGIFYNFIIVGEATVNVPDEIRSRYPQIPWRSMSDMRNVIAHEYFQVNFKIVWNTIENYLPSLVPLLEELMAQELGES